MGSAFLPGTGPRIFLREKEPSRRDDAGAEAPPAGSVSGGKAKLDLTFIPPVHLDLAASSV